MFLPPLKLVSSPNYSSRGGQKIRLFVVHDCEGSYAGSVSWFSQARSQVSAHWVLRDDGGEVTQMVVPANKAWHCFSGGERYIGRGGVRRFEDDAGTIQDVLTPSGFKKATIKRFGKQPLRTVTLYPAVEVAHWRNGRRFFKRLSRTVPRVIKVTADHVWPLENGTLTSGLKIGDVVRSGVCEPDQDSAQFRLGVRDGFVFGDGYLQSTEKAHMRFAAPMHGEKDLAMASYFEDVAFWPSRAKREHTYRGTGLCNSTRNLKDIPPSDSSPDYLAGFLKGWSTADGCDRGSFITLSSIDRSALELVAELAPTMGMAVCGPIQTYTMGPTNYRPGNPHYMLNIRKPLPWIVNDITESDEEDVFCAQFPQSDPDKLFILDGGVLTHNCCNANPYSVGLEMAGFAAKGFTEPEWQAAANVSAYLMKRFGIPCQWAKHGVGAGFCSHSDLGVSGGGHHDPMDPTEGNPAWAHFMSLIEAAYASDMPSAWGGEISVAPAAPPNFTPNPAPRHDHEVGSIEWVQMRLNALGFSHPALIVDGIMGPSTEFSVRIFQQIHGLNVDGDPGPQTVSLLERSLLSFS